jgi:Tol biopolymer transport system component
MSRHIPIVLAAALGLAVGAPAAHAGVLPADSTAVISGTPDLLSTGTPVDGSGLNSVAFKDVSNQMVAIRPEDQHVLVVFSSRAAGLAADAGGDHENVYVKDLTNGDVQLVSRRSDVNGAPGEPSDSGCFHPVISGNARVVAFACHGSLDPADPGNQDQVYARNLRTGVTTLVSRDGSAGPVADSFSDNPSIDTAGDAIAFETGATNLGGVDGSGGHHVYVRQIAGGDAMTLVSATDSNQGGTAIEGESPSISGDGTLVAFSSFDRVNYVPDGERVFVRRVSPGINEIVDRTSDTPGGPGAIANSSAFDPIISEDGTKVAFATFATNLDPASDSDDKIDVYVRTLESSGVPGAGTTKLADVNGGVKAIDGVPTSIDRTGDVVTFRSRKATGGNEIYATQPGGGYVLVSRGDGTASAASDDSEHGAVSPDGKLVAFDTGRAITSDVDPQFSSVAVRDLANATTRTVSRPPGSAPFVNVGGAAQGGSVSGDGRYVAFTSTASAFGVPLGSGKEAFVRDVLTGALTLVSRSDDGAALAGDVTGEPTISADGRRVAFGLKSPGGGIEQVYVRDWQAGRTFVVSVPDGPQRAGVLGDDNSIEPSISDDGSRVAFMSFAHNLNDGYVTRDVHLHVREIDANRTVLVDRADGVDGAEADGSPGVPVISGDGHAVAFASFADNLQPGITGLGSVDVYLRDIERFTTRLVSVTQDGKGAQSTTDVGAVSVSRDGSRVAFLSDSKKLVPPPDTAPAEPTLYVKDFAHGGALTLAARADGAAGAIVPVLDSLMSEDGSHVAFTVAPGGTVIAPGAPADRYESFERDLATGTTRLISRAPGAGGAPGTGLPKGLGGITADGGCIAFAYDGRLLPPPASAGFEHVYMRVVEPNCGRPVPVPPSGPGPSPPARPAVLSGLSVKPARFFIGGRKGGTRIVFRLDRASSVTLTFSRLLPAHRKGKRCLTTVRKGKRCTVVRVVGRLTVHKGRKGSNTVKFSGKLGRRALARGGYRLTATPSHGRARTAKFAVVRAPKAKPKSKPKHHGK